MNKKFGVKFLVVVGMCISFFSAQSCLGMERVREFDEEISQFDINQLDEIIADFSEQIESLGDDILILRGKRDLVEEERKRQKIEWSRREERERWRGFEKSEAAVAVWQRLVELLAGCSCIGAGVGLLDYYAKMCHRECFSMYEKVDSSVEGDTLLCRDGEPLAVFFCMSLGTIGVICLVMGARGLTLKCKYKMREFVQKRKMHALKVKEE